MREEYIVKTGEVAQLGLKPLILQEVSTMAKVKEAWRFRKRSEADPVKQLPCGCRVQCCTGQVIRFCAGHESKIKDDSEHC